MVNRTYHIDPEEGDDSNSGLETTKPRRTCQNLHLLPGDTVFFKRGSVFRGCLETCDGSEQGDITYSAYGTGEKPVFLGSMQANGSENWREESPSIWRFNGAFSSEVCNLIFNDGESCGNLRWRLADLKCQGEWFYTQLGHYAEMDNASDESADKNLKMTDGILYLFSASNPGLFYTSIECSLWGNRKMVGGQQHIILDNLVFKNAGVHGYQEIRAHHITIRNCEFRFIGGAVWSRKLKIRFGNAVELWDEAQDVTVENCIFSNIYDSGVTHQGSDESGPYERIYFRNNLFADCGMAAYECRGPAAGEVYFENNTCIRAGGGFSMQGEEPPRQSEIYPQPMGHHVFIWRIDKHTQQGFVYIRNNVFYEAPFGAALYSVIDPDDEQRFVIDNNCYYQSLGQLHARMNGRFYGRDQFLLYQKETGHDRHSIFADPCFADVARGVYKLRKDSPCIDKGRMVSYMTEERLLQIIAADSLYPNSLPDCP